MNKDSFVSPRYLLAASLLVSSASAQVTTLAVNDGASDIPLAQLVFTDPSIPPFGKMRANYDGVAWTIRPNADTPSNFFGWLEGPLVSVKKPLDGLSGNNTQMRVTYSFNTGTTGTFPTMRLRFNTNDFTQTATSDVTAGRFNQLRGTGRGTATVAFDRSLLSADTTMRLFIDMYQAEAAGVVSADFFVRIEKVELVSTVSDASYPREKLISLAYREDDGDVFAHVGGSSERTRLRSSADRFAYDGPYAIALDTGILYGYNAVKGLGNEIEIEDNDVVSAAISGHQVIFLQDNYDLKVYNFLTNDAKTIDTDTGLYGVSAAGDGTLIAAQLSNNRFRLYQYDTRLSNPELERIASEYLVIDVSTRSTGSPVLIERPFGVQFGNQTLTFDRLEVNRVGQASSLSADR